MLVGRAVWFKKIMTCECSALDMTYLTKQLSFEYEGWTTVSWRSTWGRETSVGIDSVPPYRIRIHYTSIGSNGERTPYSYYVYLESTPCNYGGKRWWFICPDCGRRCRVIYLPKHAMTFACRICHHLCYESQQEGKSMWWPLFTAMNKLGHWELKYCRARSPRSKARFLKKINSINGGMQRIVSLGRRRRRRHRRDG